MIWMSAGWIFHPIHSVVVLVGSVVIIVAISAYIAKLGYLQKINWGSRVHQNIATRGSIAIAALVTLYMFWGHNHIILFTIIGAIIIAVVLKDTCHASFSCVLVSRRTLKTPGLSISRIFTEEGPPVFLRLSHSEENPAPAGPQGTKKAPIRFL